MIRRAVHLTNKLKERKGRKNCTWSNASVNRYTEAICAILNFSVKQRRIPYNPLVGFRKLANNSPEMLFWDDKEASSFLAWADEKYFDWNNTNPSNARKNYLAYLAVLNTGLRAGELWGLKVSDLQTCKNEAGATIFVQRQLNAITRQYGPLKGELVTNSDKSRHVPCPKILQDALCEMIQHNNIKKTEPIFQSVYGNPVTHKSFDDRFKRDIKRWGGKKIRFHDLRHTAATLMLSKGVDVKTVSEILGHEDLSTTMIYGLYVIRGGMRLLV
jgi:integrase